MRPFLFAFFLFFLLPAFAQVTGSIPEHADTAAVQKIIPSLNAERKLLDSNIFINSKRKPEALSVLLRKEKDDMFFYVVLGLLLLLGILKTIYSRYFNTLFRVFFNTSLRQNQLTDQLEQATVPSFLFNIFFMLTGGLYLYIMLRHFIPAVSEHRYLLYLCIAAVAICYSVKFLTLSFTGWITNYKQEAETYIFIVFLLNKVIGILLLPFIILSLFSTGIIASYAIFISIIALLLVVLVRLFRSYSLLQNRLKISGFHFMLYVFALEILPIILIYKGAMLFFG